MKRKSLVFSLIFLFFISSLNIGSTEAALNHDPTFQTNATDILLTFDDIPDFTNLVSAYPGVTFSAD